jgi:hypothetical protein
LKLLTEELNRATVKHYCCGSGRVRIASSANSVWSNPVL